MRHSTSATVKLYVLNAASFATAATHSNELFREIIFADCWTGPRLALDSSVQRNRDGNLRQ